MSLTLVILAAGAGTRYGGLKQLAPIGPYGQTLLEYSAFDASRAGFDRVVLVVRPETELAFREQLDDGMAERLSVAYAHQSLEDPPEPGKPSVERTKPWGTGQAVLMAEPEIDGPFAVVNADDFYGADSYASIARFLIEGHEPRRLAVLGFPVGETLTEAGPVSRALLELDGEGCLVRIVEMPEVWREGGSVRYRDAGGEPRTLDGCELVSMNMWGLHRQMLADLDRRFRDFLKQSGHAPDAEFILPDVIQALVSSGRFRVEVLQGSGEWCGITFSEDLCRVRSVIRTLVSEGRYPDVLWA